MAAAWLLNQNNKVTLFEASTHLGGHAHTVDISLDGVIAPVDTGFMVFNRQTYPNLVRLFEALGITAAPSEMSFSLSLEEPDLEWSGSSARTLFAQPRNLLRPDFLGMLRDILRFNRDAARAADDPAGVFVRVGLPDCGVFSPYCSCCDGDADLYG